MKISKIMMAGVICAAMMLTTACNGNSGTNESTPVSTPESVPASTPKSDPVSTPENDPASTPESDPTATGNIHGTWSGTTYNSEFIGIKADFGSDCVVMTDEQIAVSNNVSDCSNETILSTLSSLGVFIDMQVQQTEINNVNIVIEDTNKSKTPNDPDKYFTVVPEVVASQMKALGAESQATVSSVTFLGAETKCIELVTSAGGLTVYQVSIPIFKDNYIFNITCSADTMDNAKKLAGLFSKV